jgi:predicted translin family RNA/ssDNA-binding protein
MAFDLLSLMIGVAAGALTGSLAGILHSLERTAEIQDRVCKLAREVERMKGFLSTNNQQGNSRLDDLDRDLEEIHGEIRRMYKRTTR